MERIKKITRVVEEFVRKKRRTTDYAEMVLSEETMWCVSEPHYTHF